MTALVPGAVGLSGLCATFVKLPAILGFSVKNPMLERGLFAIGRLAISSSISFTNFKKSFCAVTSGLTESKESTSKALHGTVGGRV